MEPSGEGVTILSNILALSIKLMCQISFFLFVNFVVDFNENNYRYKEWLKFCMFTSSLLLMCFAGHEIGECWHVFILCFSCYRARDILPVIELTQMYDQSSPTERHPCIMPALNPHKHMCMRIMLVRQKQ